jgi:hypothetical protein
MSLKIWSSVLLPFIFLSFDIHFKHAAINTMHFMINNHCIHRS